MKLYKFDTHVHTVETSPCGKVKAVDLVKLYQAAGYDGIVITDHFFDGFFDRLGGKSWDKKVDRFLEGYRIAAAEGKKAGISVLLGMEIRFTENFNDYLVYGFDEAFLKENKELYSLGLEKFKKLASDRELLVVQAHPFRIGVTPAKPSLLDGVEVYNGNPRHESHNDLALRFAEKNSLLMTSGSDFHQVADLARGGVWFSDMAENPEEFASFIKDGGIRRLVSS